MIERTNPSTGEGTLAVAVAAVVGAVPGVARLCGGKAGEIATYLPGRRVSGVRISDDGVDVHLVARWVASLPQLAQDVRTALRPVVGDRPVSVFVEDVEVAALESRGTAPTPPGTGDENSWARSVI